jgi:hypothetical protein
MNERRRDWLRRTDRKPAERSDKPRAGAAPLPAAFARARLHDNAAAEKLAEAYGARAVTIGEDIYFARGQLRPDTPDGRQLIAHELAHVAQQGRGGTGDRAQAEAEAERAATAHSTGAEARVGTAMPRAPQCDPDPAQAAQPKLVFEPAGLQDQVRVNGIAVYRVRHVTAGKPVQHAATASGGSYQKLPAAPYARGGVSVSLRYTIALHYTHAVLIEEIPGGLKALQALFPAVEFASQAVVHTDVAALEAEAKQQAAEQTLRDKLRPMALELGRLDLEQGEDRFDFAPLAPKSPNPYAQHDAQAKAEADLQFARGLVKRNVALADSVAKSHFRSRRELDDFMERYIAAAGEVSADRAAAAEAERAAIDAALLDAQGDILLREAQLDFGRQITEGQVSHMRLPVPEFLKRTSASAAVVGLPVIYATDFLLDFVPYLGVLKLAIEGVSGMSLTGQIEQSIETLQPMGSHTNLEIEDRLIRMIPLVGKTAGRILSKAPGWAESLSRLKTLTQMSDDELAGLLKTLSRIEGREKEVVQRLLMLREARRMALKQARAAALGPAFMFTGAGGVGSMPTRLPGGARRGVQLVLEVDAGLDANDVRRKAEALNGLCSRREVVKTQSPTRSTVAGGTGAAYRGMPVSVQSEYKYRLLEIAHKRFGPTSPNYEPERWRKFFELWKSKSGDHVLDLQLSGADDIGNLWLFDLETNVALGRQIRQQLSALPDGTKITGVTWRIKGQP